MTGGQENYEKHGKNAGAHVVLDLFSRRAVGWSMNASMTAQLVTDALTMALWRRGKPARLLHHSDQGSQYTSELFQKLLADHGITCSMSRRGDCWDNAAMESFFSTMKTERTSKRNYTTRGEACPRPGLTTRLQSAQPEEVAETSPSRKHRLPKSPSEFARRSAVSP